MSPLETYLRELAAIRASGQAVEETSCYAPLANLLGEIDKPLKPKIRCVPQIKNKGAGIPDGAFCTSDQLKNLPDAAPPLRILRASFRKAGGSRGGD